MFRIFRRSLSYGVIPEEWKIAKIIPVFKSGDAILHTKTDYALIGIKDVSISTSFRIFCKYSTITTTTTLTPITAYFNTLEKNYIFIKGVLGIRASLRALKYAFLWV